MFPSLKMSVSGLDPDANYVMIMELRLSDSTRYKFSCGVWTGVGAADPQPLPNSRVYVHPDSTSKGASWMAQDIHFQKAKLTNNTLDSAGNLVLTSMHKYQPYIHIVKDSGDGLGCWCPYATFTFADTEFIAVTAYQNENITRLKIDNNPFAKAFRENGQAKTKRKIQGQSKNEDTQEEDKEDQSDNIRNSMEDVESINLSMDSESNTIDVVTQSQSDKKIKVEYDSGISVGSASPLHEERTSSPNEVSTSSPNDNRTSSPNDNRTSSPNDEHSTLPRQLPAALHHQKPILTPPYCRSSYPEHQIPQISFPYFAQPPIWSFPHFFTIPPWYCPPHYYPNLPPF